MSLIYPLVVCPFILMLFIDRKHDFGRQQRSVQENDDVDAYERFRILSALYGD